MLGVNDKPKNFKLIDAFGKYHQLSDYLGNKIVLYFYPKDSTPGCTKQACTFRDNYHLFKKLGVVVIGISRDSVASHKRFVDKHKLPFILLSDEHGVVLKDFGVWKQKKLFGKKYMGILRTTFLINEEGVITKVFEKASPANNAGEILDVLENKGD